MHQGFEIELLDDCVLSRRNATVGGHQCLDHVPGSALLGIVAAGLYRELAPEQSFLAFHSGALRFGNGLPVQAGQAGRPLPLAWHRYKNESVADAAGCLQPGQLVNRLFGYAGNKQIKPLREGFVTTAGQWLRPLRTQRMKTAVSPDTGRAADSQLFGYQSLQRGQRFRTVLTADEDFDAALFARVCESLEGRRLLGRSRSGEYGRVRITRLEQAAAAPDRRAPAPVEGQEWHFLWLLSDLAPHDVMGSPTSRFDPAALGLGGLRVDFAHSFARMRGYSPWNAARRGHDQERQVLVAGSVLCLLGSAPDASILARGLGLYREQGLGQVCLDPALLADKQPVWHGTAGLPPTAAAPARPASPLLNWLARRHDEAHDDIDAWVGAQAKQIADTLQAARRLGGVPRGQDFGPSRSQWSRVQRAASGSIDAKALYRTLFDEARGVIKEKGEGWGVSMRDDGQPTSFAAWLRQRFSTWQDDPAVGPQLARHVRHLAHRLRNQTGSR